MRPDERREKREEIKEKRFSYFSLDQREIRTSCREINMVFVLLAITL